MATKWEEWKRTVEMTRWCHWFHHPENNNNINFFVHVGITCTVFLCFKNISGEGCLFWVLRFSESPLIRDGERDLYKVWNSGRIKTVLAHDFDLIKLLFFFFFFNRKWKWLMNEEYLVIEFRNYILNISFLFSFSFSFSFFWFWQSFSIDKHCPFIQSHTMRM